MNDVEELRQFALVHARTQTIPPDVQRAVLARIRSDEEGAPGSWAVEWSRAGAAREAAGDLLGAARAYTMARFPYPDGPARQAAQDALTGAFDRWRRQHPRIRRLDVDLPGGRVRCWASGLSADRPRPVLLISGGIVTVKEQWAPVLLQARRLGMAGIVTEMPGVGENTLRYDADAWRMFPAVLDAVKDRADVARTYAVALSFSGHMALRAALADRRIRGIATAGAPVSDFFTDRVWQRALPRVTVDTLAHLAGGTPRAFPEQMRDWAVGGAELAGLDIPVCLTLSLRDEIIPRADVRFLARHVADVTIKEHDDVHGSPDHVAETRLWTVRSVLRMKGGHRVQRAAIGAASGLLRLRGGRGGRQAAGALSGAAADDGRAVR